MTFPMDDSFQFIIESPQHNHGHKKRPRLVTSCDNCRLKKIKCIQPAPETKCDACKAAKIPCRFRDRERYFAERSRAIAGPNTPSSYGDNQSQSETNASLDAFSLASGSSNSSVSSPSETRSNSHSPRANGVVSAENASSSRFQSYPPDPRRGNESYHTHTNSSMSYEGSRPDSPGYDFVSANSQNVYHNTSSRLSSHRHHSRSIHLFDPEYPQRPHPSLMPHFIQLFFERLGGEFLFLSYEETLAEYWDQRLSPLLANCIAAMAARYSNVAELTVRGLHNVVETYSDNAKTILSSVAHIPTMETLHALMILSWSEYKSNKSSGFRAYCQMAMRMAIDLGLSDQTAIQMNPSERERNRGRATWANIAQLHLTASSQFRS